jgi:N-acetylneuraminate synthase
MNPDSWRDMVDRTRELERALGSAEKFVAENEQQTVILQRRCLRAARDLRAGEILTREMITVLRPATPGALLPTDLDAAVGTRVLRDLKEGQELRWTDLGAA